MKIEKLVKELKAIKKKFGNIDVAFYEGSINPEVEQEYSVHTVDILGAFKIPFYESGRNKKMVVLKGAGQTDFIFENEPLRE
jgi:hypothetical protein